MAGITLAQAPLHTPLLLVGGSNSASAECRLAALGIRRGARLSVLQKTAGGGRVVVVGGSRIALGPEVLANLTANVIA